ncbi:unnamed protein product [Pneumocystis jirovecii]|uniref:Ubiquitin-like domain-containing protein n=1 Tax=Pneumocystis jirovecii TaxID=42068 RepID=L0PE49_PNEJI|nr:unnamed protein product [Pneumocystis jirovecii]
MEAEKCFARSFLQQLEQKPVKFSEEFIAPLSRLDIVPQELNLPEINLPQWDGLNELRIEEQIDITIKTLRGPKKTTNIKARHSDTIYCIKKSVSNAFNVDLSQIRLLNKGKVLMDTKLVSDILESNQTKALLQLMIMEKKVPAEKTQISCKITEPTTTTQNETVQLLKLDTSFWEDLKAFLSTKLDTYANTKT